MRASSPSVGGTRCSARRALLLAALRWRRASAAARHGQRRTGAISRGRRSRSSPIMRSQGSGEPGFQLRARHDRARSSASRVVSDTPIEVVLAVDLPVHCEPDRGLRHELRRHQHPLLHLRPRGRRQADAGGDGRPAALSTVRAQGGQARGRSCSAARSPGRHASPARRRRSRTGSRNRRASASRRRAAAAPGSGPASPPSCRAGAGRAGPGAWAGPDQRHRVDAAVAAGLEQQRHVEHDEPARRRGRPRRRNRRWLARTSGWTMASSRRSSSGRPSTMRPSACAVDAAAGGRGSPGRPRATARDRRAARREQRVHLARRSRTPARRRRGSVRRPGSCPWRSSR